MLTSSVAVSKHFHWTGLLRPQVFGELARLLVLIGAHTVRYGFLRLLSKSRTPAELLGACLRAYLVQMGPLYIKAGQILATQAGWLTNEARQELRSLFSQVPPESQEAIVDVLDSCYGPGRDALFKSFDLTPIAAGSVAQVHVAHLEDGTKLAVKIVRPGVKAHLLKSIKALLLLGYILHYGVPRLRHHRLPGRIQELRESILAQADMTVELQQLQDVQRNFKNHAYLRLPEPFPELSHSNILVMTYVEGISGEHVSQLSFSKDSLANRLQDIFYTMVFFHGAYHLDPHPGNFVFNDCGEITLLDFGLMGYLGEQDKWKLSAFYYACVRKEWPLSVKRFTDCFVQEPQVLHESWSDYSRDLTTVLRNHFEDEVSRWSTMLFIDDAIKVLTRYKACLAVRFSQLALAFLTGEGFISIVNPDIDIWKNARRFTDRASPYVSDEVKRKFDDYFTDKIPNTLAQLAHFDQYLVAPTHLHRYFLPSAYPLIVKSAEGCWLRDIDGNVYLDLSNGYGPHLLGYGSAVVRDAISDALRAGTVNALANEYELRFAEKIATAFWPDSKVILANSGTEAVLMAIRLARTFTGRVRCAKFEGHYHGFSDQGMVSSWFAFHGTKEAPQPIQGCPGAQPSIVTETLVLQYGSDRTFELIEANKDSLACIICEPMPGGLANYDIQFLTRLRECCDKFGIVLIFDEVVTGFRAAYGGVQNLIGVQPDLTCLGKIIGGSLPCGAVVGKRSVIDCSKTSKDPFIDVENKTFVGGTLSGNSLTAAAGLAVLDYLSSHPELYDHLNRLTTQLTQLLSDTAARHSVPLNVKGRHSIFSITFDSHAPKYVRDRHAGTNFKANIALSYYMRKRDVYMPELHTMMLSEAHSEAELNKVNQAFDGALTEMKDDGLFTL